MNDTATSSLKAIICTRPNLQMLILNSPGPLCSMRAKRVFLGAEGKARPRKRPMLSLLAFHCNFHSFKFTLLYNNG